MTAIKPRTARVVIYQGDDLARLSELDNVATKAEVALRTAERAAKDDKRTRLMHEDPTADVIPASEAYERAQSERDEFAAEAEERGVTVVLHSLPRKEWRRLRNSHPPREDNAEDQGFDCNVDTLPDEAVPMSVDRATSTIEGDVEQFLDSLNSHDFYQRLFMTVLALNVGSAAADPKARLLSTGSPISAATSS